MEQTQTPTLRDDINHRFCQAVNFILKNRLARNKNEIMERLGLYLGRLSLILGGKANVSTDNLSLLAKTYGISAEWLLMGNGPMMARFGGNMAGAEAQPVKEPQAGSLPLIPIAALAGFNGIDEPGVRLEECAHYLVPEFAQAGADFLIRVQGISMQPTFVSGDLVACKKLDADSWVDFGDVYVIDGLQGIMIKRLFNDSAAPDQFLCRSDNPEVAPFSVAKSEVRSLSKVIGVVRTL